ncbi:MAG: thiamine phosphate synthase [Cytophagaceae bacterium]|nr:thiamine phosphate synthase [Cytophagaceae bacterium]
MKIIVISNPVNIQKEHEAINALFESGLEYFHLRKPDTDKASFENFLRDIKPAFYRRISIHSHYSLIGKYNLGGIHIPEKMRMDEEVKEICKTARKKNLKVSTSIHQLEDPESIKSFDYAFLSPVFNSISKENYKSAFDPEELQKFLKGRKPEIIALGGIEENNILKAAELGFYGAALHGTIWKDFEKDQDVNKVIEKFKLLIQKQSAQAY